jgi:hypothetical protein
VFGQNFGRVVLPLAIAVSAAGNVMVVTFTLVGFPFHSISLFSLNLPSVSSLHLPLNQKI